MNILITGGTGLIGQAIINHRPDLSFTILSRQAAPTNLASHCSWLQSLDSLTNLDTYDAVINLAGEPIADKRWSTSQKHQLTSSRWQLTEQLANLFNRSSNPPRVWLSGSAIGVYGDGGDKPLNEQSPAGSDFAATLCNTWESHALKAADSTRVVLLRTGIVLSTKGGALGKMLLPFKLCLGGPIGKGSQYMSYIHIDDYVRAIDLLLSTDAISGPVNLTAPSPVTNTQFTQSLAKALGRIAPFWVPSPALKLLMGESSSLLLDSQRVLPYKLQEAGFEFKFSDISMALDDLLAKG